jgi:resolvase-like protein
VIVDEDLGKSGASAVGRLGFQGLVAAVSLGQAGAVFGLEVSRLARNNRDWYQLLDLCALMNTLIVDAEGVYGPRQLNDRLLLGLKGTMILYHGVLATRVVGFGRPREDGGADLSSGQPDAAGLPRYPAWAAPPAARLRAGRIGVSPLRQRGCA